jgi:hypothetical protein
MGFSKCWKCKTDFWMPDDLEAAARNSRGDITVYCAYGHPGCFKKKSDEQLEIDRLKQSIAQRDDEIARQQRAIDFQRSAKERIQRSLTATRGVITRVKNRIGHGVCPCCNRTFHNLANHMKSQHADYAKSPIGEAK